MTHKVYAKLNNQTEEIATLYGRDSNNTSVKLSKLYGRDENGLSKLIFNSERILFQDDCTGLDVSDLWDVTGTADYYQDVYIQYQKALRVQSGTSIVIPIEVPNNFVLDLDCKGNNYWAWFRFRMCSSPDNISDFKSIYTNSCSYDTDTNAPIHTTYFANSTTYDHIQIVRSGNTWKVYERGSLAGTATVDCTGYNYILFTGSYIHLLRNILLKG